jgi:acyl carrier protein
MSHKIEIAAADGASCRACGQTLVKGELCFGWEFANPCAEDGETSFSYLHLGCAAVKLPNELAPVLAAYEGTFDDRVSIELLIARCARPEVPYLERAPNGGSHCKRRPLEDFAIGADHRQAVVSEDARETMRLALLEVAPEKAELLVEMAPDTSLDDCFDDLGLDWISSMELVAVLERMLKTSFTDDELASLRTLADFLLLVERRPAVGQGARPVHVRYR